MPQRRGQQERTDANGNSRDNWLNYRGLRYRYSRGPDARLFMRDRVGSGRRFGF